MRESVVILLGAAVMVATIGAAPDSVSEIAVKGRASAYASIAARGQISAIAWGASTPDGATDVYSAVSRDGGASYGVPTRVNDVGNRATLSGEQPPRIALVPRIGKDPAIVVVWTAKSPSGTRLLSARSVDSGRTFAAAVPVPGSEAAGNRGWETIATNADGSVVAVWLDHRGLASSGSMSHTEHQHLAPGQNKADGVVRAQLSKLFFATLGTESSSHAIAGGVCYCCKTATATDAAGDVYAAWRQVYDGNIRDIAFSKSSDAGRTFSAPVRVSDDHWVLDGCPENGPALAVDRRKRIHVVWPTLLPGTADAPTLAIYYAMSNDGIHFTPRQQIPTEGVPRHVQAALGPDDEIIAVWDEQAGGRRRIAMARGRSDATGTTRFVRQLIDDAAPAAYPILATADAAAIVGWTSGTTGQTALRVKRVAY